jgi:hypothetical protein
MVPPLLLVWRQGFRVEHLPGNCEALSSIPSTAKNKTNKKPHYCYCDMIKIKTVETD